jgi:hypothetical protein
MLIGAAVVLGVVVKGMLENVAAIVGQAIKLFGVLLLMFVVAVVLVAGAVSHASTESPAPSPSTTAPIISSEPRVGS